MFGAFMLARRDEQQVIDAVLPVMTMAGFQRRESTWYRFSTETVQVFDVQAAASPLSQCVHLNLGVEFRELHPVTHLRVWDCSVYGRLDHVIPDGELFSKATDFAEMSISPEERLHKIVGFVRKFALPLLDSWQTAAAVTAFTVSERSRGFTVSLKPKHDQN